MDTKLSKKVFWIYNCATCTPHMHAQSESQLKTKYLISRLLHGPSPT